LINDEQVERLCDLVWRLDRGEISQPEYIRLCAEILCPGDEEARRRCAGIMEELLDGPAFAALVTAASLPGVAVPVGPRDPESN
jgi:hypothetical protein